jgi:hypothetical protein
MSTQGTVSSVDPDILALLHNLPSAPSIFVPHGLLVAAEMVHLLTEIEPTNLMLPLHMSIPDSLACALEKSIPLKSFSSPLVPQHLHSIDKVPMQERRVVLADTSDSWCRLVTR